MSPSSKRTLSKPRPQPHPLKTNSVRETTMRRPAFLRKRSNSVPNLPFANVSAEEAGIIFSAAERAAARRRRPVSEYSPGPSAILANEQITSQAGVAACQLSEHAFDPSGALPDDSYHRLSTVHEARSSTASSAGLSATEIVDLDSVSASSSQTTPIIPEEILHPHPISPKRVVPTNSLKAYADSLFIFTQARLNIAVPNQPIVLSLLDPHVEVEDTQPQNPELEESSLPPRPPLVSHFSDWSQTTPETDVASDEPLSRWTLSVHSPERISQVHTPEEAGMIITPDSFFAEVTPRVSQSSRWTGTGASSPAWVSRASSPTRGSLRNFSFGSLHFQSQSHSPAPPESLSYFANFDGHTTAAEVESHLSLELSPADILRSPSTPGSLPSKHSNLVSTRAISSSASDSTPFMARDGVSPAGRQMVDLSMRPPSWLVRAIG